MGLFSSFKKSSNLRRISKELGSSLTYHEAQNQGLSGSDLMHAMLGSGEKQKKAEEELLDLCENDKQLSKIIEKYNSNRNQLKKIYNDLLVNGAGQWAGGHFCAASALVFVPTLEYVLQNKKSIGATVSYIIVDYFETGNLESLTSEALVEKTQQETLPKKIPKKSKNKKTKPKQKPKKTNLKKDLEWLANKKSFDFNKIDRTKLIYYEGGYKPMQQYKSTRKFPLTGYWGFIEKHRPNNKWKAYLRISKNKYWEDVESSGYCKESLSAWDSLIKKLNKDD
jgi:hypothetical protein